MSAMIPDLHFVLLHVQPTVSLFLKEEAQTSVLARKKMEKISNRNARNTCEIEMEDHPPDTELEDIIVRGDKACIDQFYARALEKFKQAGISEERVRFKTIEGRRRIGKAVMDFAEKGDYHTLVVGRRGMERSFFMGSVSRYMINNLSDGALWMVP